jgi:ADP-heptose:LPS heptosyltransferase
MKQYLKRPILKLLWSIGSSIGHLFDRPLQKEQISKILVFQGGGIGDVIRLFPALQSLHAAFPHASIVALTQYGNTLFRFFPSPEIISEHLLYDLHGKHKTLFQKFLFIRSLKKRKFDLIFSPNYGLGMIEAMIMSSLIGAPYRIGFDKDGAGFLYTTKKELAVNKSIQEQNLDLLSRAGVTIKDQEHYLNLSIPQEDLTFARSSLKSHGVSSNDVIMAIAPDVKADVKFKSFPEYRSWPYDRYIELIKGITSRYKAKVILVGNRPQQPQEADSYQLLAKMDTNILNFMGRTTIAQAAALISYANLFIGNDSGPLHIAIALRKPCIGIFGATSPTQVISHSDHCVPLWKNLACSPCFSHQPLFDLKCPYRIECLHSITVNEVMETIEKLLHTELQ